MAVAHVVSDLYLGSAAVVHSDVTGVLYPSEDVRSIYSKLVVVVVVTDLRRVDTESFPFFGQVEVSADSSIGGDCSKLGSLQDLDIRRIVLDRDGILEGSG